MSKRKKYDIPDVLKTDPKTQPVVTTDMIPADRRAPEKNKILFINPPIRLEHPPRHIPYGIAQLAANLDLEGYDVAVLDANAYRELLDWNLFRDALKMQGHEQWGFIGVGGLVTTYGWQKQAFKHLREMYPNTPLVAGGGAFSSLEDHMLRWNKEIDVGVVGEADVTILELADWLINQRTRPHKIKGIIYRKYMEDYSNEFPQKRKKTWRKTVRTKPRPLLKEEELNKLPYPYLAGVPLEVYFANSALPLAPLTMRCKRRIDVISERGCPHRCTFCYHNMLGAGRVRFQSPEYIVNMITYWRYKYGVDFVSFLDENITANRQRCLDLCNLLEEKELSSIIYWGCLGRVDNVDRVLLERMHQCGCVYISYGGESGSQKVLDGYKKKTTPSQMKEAISATMSAEINPIMTFMVGAPNEDIEDVLQTVKFWIDNRILTVPFFVTPYPKTELFEKYKTKILRQYSETPHLIPVDLDETHEWNKESEGAYERFVMQCGDATAFTANISRHFNDAELSGMQQLMARHMVKRIIDFGAKREGWSRSKIKKLKRQYIPRFVEPFSVGVEVPKSLRRDLGLEKEEEKPYGLAKGGGDT